MLEATLELFWAFLAGFLGGAVCSLGMRWAISRRCLRNEVAILDLQRFLLSVKGKAGADARWSKQERETEELMALAKERPAPTREKFTNDPLTWGNDGTVR